MKVNWKVRIKNKAFWIAVIPAIALVAQAVASIFGFTLDLSTLVGKILSAVDAVFVLLVILGIVVDPTTAGFGDSVRALGYEVPCKDIVSVAKAVASIETASGSEEDETKKEE